MRWQEVDDVASEVLTSAQAAEYLQLAPATLKRMAREGRVPAAKVGRQWRFRKADLDRWLALGGDLQEELVDEGMAILRAERMSDAASPETRPLEEVLKERGL